MDELGSFKDSLQQKIWDAYESGLQLSEGCRAFLDEEQKCFIDGFSLKPLTGEQAAEAEEAFASLTPEQRMTNSSYLATCALYQIADRMKTTKTAFAFNTATRENRSTEAEPVSRIIQRIFRLPFAPKL
jgi:hypothetical protein